MPPSAATNGKAITALVLGILGLCCGILGIGGIIFGVLARNEIRASGGRQKGEGLALAGIVLGGLSALWMVVAVALGFFDGFTT